tara:strand:+ start:548 stop:871 length:324 start_codon:yes stop_codon:yes gene_type:complete
MIIPLIKGFKSTDISKAFLLNALAIALAAVVAIETRVQLEDEKSTLYIAVNNMFPEKKLGFILKILLVLLSGFITSLIVHIILHILFGYGAAMIIDDKFINKNPRYF